MLVETANSAQLNSVQQTAVDAVTNLPCLMQKGNVQMNGGRKQHTAANFVKRSLMRGQRAEQKECKRTEKGCRSEGARQTHNQGEGREKCYS